MSIRKGDKILSGQMSLIEIADKLYPVGCIYIDGGGSVCPLEAIVGHWEKVSNGVVSGLGSTAPVIGNGKTLGLTNGISDYGLVNSSNVAFAGATSNFGQNAGSPAGTLNATINSIGITTNAENSGIIADLSNSATTVSCVLWKRVL